jgi:hypothetical protein
MDYILAVARPSHIDAMVKLCVAAYKEGPEPSVPNKDKMLDYVDAMVRDDHQLALVALSNGVPKGLIIGEVAGHAFCDGLVASDTVIYVKPALRGTDAAKDLITAYSDWVDRIPNLIGSSLGISQLGASTQYLDSVYRSLGYRKVGYTYMRGAI